MDIAEWLLRCPLIAILRGITPHEIVPVVGALYRAGVRVAEIPLNSPDPLTSIALASANFGQRMLIGAGTVTTSADVQQVQSAGGKLIVTPHADPEIVREAKHRGLIALPGCATATEAFAMIRAGADGLKLFPAEVGGIQLLRALRAVLPLGTKLIPVGGIDVKTIGAWKAEGVAGFGVGSALYRPGDQAETVEIQARSLVDLSAS